ncbi:MAG: phage major capsid protein, partial [Anaerolineae bacterium]|nr:phage major capsid protein [Anaerolineae bacterium]
TSVIPLKAYLERAEPFVKALLPQDAGNASADATKAQPEPEPTETKSPESETMDNEQIQALIDAAVTKATETATAAAIKAYEEKLAAEPVANPMEYDTGNGATKSATKSQPAEAKAKQPEFKGFGDFLTAVRRSQTPGMSSDNRLDYLKAASGLNETDPGAGGYLVAPQYATEIFKRSYENGALASRVRRVPMSSNTLKLNGVDESSRATGSRWGGVRAYWRAEANTVTATAPQFRQMTLTLNELMAFYYATDEVLADTTALGSLASEAYADEFGWQLDNAILRGTGAGQPAGILSAASTVSVAKESGQSAATVLAENIVKMRARLWARSRPTSVWFINQDVEPQLHLMSMPVGTGGIPVYMPANGLSGLPYDTLYGRPIIPIEQCSTLGTVGDIVLADLSQYVLGEKGGMEAAASMHVRFLYAEQTFRFMMRVDGQPLWQSALTPANGSNTLSPFITLATRS